MELKKNFCFLGKKRIILKFSKYYFLILLFFPLDTVTAQKLESGILKNELIKEYVDVFNAFDEELYIQKFSNLEAADFMIENIPLFECPDKNVERTYYFRWWTYRKHIKETADGYIITEFLPNVSWAACHNAITCAGLFHFLEGRWMRSPLYLQDYANFWIFHSGYHPSSKWKHFRAVLGHAFPLSDAILQFHKVHQSNELITNILQYLSANYEELKKLRKTEIGMYWSNAGGWEGDGMEVAIGGNGIRPTINSYMYSQAKALSEMFLLKGDKGESKRYEREAEKIADLIIKNLWDEKDCFFKVMRTGDFSTKKLAEVRELLGYVPWCYSIPPKNKGYEQAWSQILNKSGFYAPYGLTTCEQRHSKFMIAYKGHDCQWNGPSWPYATSQTLMAMANVIQDYPQDVITQEDYLNQFLIYTNSHRLQKEDNSVVPWIDENLNPFTGDWIARTMLKSKEKVFSERGKDYNHSTYVDLLITGLIGFKPRLDDAFEINPCIPEKAWDYFCLDKIWYKGHLLTIIWDKTGEKYKLGSGLIILSDDKEIARSSRLIKMLVKL